MVNTWQGPSIAPRAPNIPPMDIASRPSSCASSFIFRRRSTFGFSFLTLGYKFDAPFTVAAFACSKSKQPQGLVGRNFVGMVEFNLDRLFGPSAYFETFLQFVFRVQ